MSSRSRDVVLEGRTTFGANPGGSVIWIGEVRGRGMPVYEQPGARVDKDRTKRKGGIPSK